ncbi:MAG: type II toxin-antitoxin system VapC family toxin [Vulcanimicrobiota bacterium]
MSYLLDTHALLWAVAEPLKLSEPARITLSEPKNELLVSSISIFEIATKIRIGKLNVPDTLVNSWQLTLAKLNAKLLTVGGDDAALAGLWDCQHPDPFDRILAAQAINGNHYLVSCDAAFRHFKSLRVYW